MTEVTKNQRRAIEANGNVLVEAGAGAGKTRVLVQRCISWLLRDPANSIDQILMVTFTDAAAAEMRHRIREELTARFREIPEHAHLAEQLALLDSAAISTLHSFCFRLVRQHFSELEIDPQVTVMTDPEAKLLADEILDGVLQKHYAGSTANSAAIQQLIQAHGRGWDSTIRRMILRLYHYMQTLPEPERWFREQLAVFSEDDPHRWRRWLDEAIPEWRASWLDFFKSSGSNQIPVPQIVCALERLAPDASREVLAASLGEMLDLTRDLRAANQKKHAVIPKEFLKDCEFLHSITATDGDRDPLHEDWNWSRPHMTALLQLSREFEEDFARAKREKGQVDFHDLEQFTLRLLWDRTTGGPTALAREWRSRLELIFVDEYQDINAAQDAIIRCLARDGREANRFLVGDIKQSIYRFRLAAPRIFQSYSNAWRQEKDAMVIPLSENFRSHEAILHFINGVFATLMRREVGGIEYDQEAILKLGDRNGRQMMAIAEAGATNTTIASVAPDNEHVEIHLRLTERRESEKPEEPSEGGQLSLAELSKAQQEARMIGCRLRELREQGYAVWDEKEKRQRAVEWRDMVVLMRAPRGKVESFAREFARLKVPLLASRGGFFESAEVGDLLSLLNLLDNPLQDIPLLTVLRSPLVGLSTNELAVVRLASTGRYWVALQYFHHKAQPRSETERGHGNPQSAATNDSSAALRTLHANAAWPKVDLFLKQFAVWRRMARETSLSQCIERVLNDTHYTDWFAAESGASGRQSNVSKLLNWARQFDQFHRQGLFRFLRFVEAQQAAALDPDPAPLETENAVRLMSIHQSKGLEFPVAVLADLGKLFNFLDLKASVILDEDYGLCPQIIPPFTQRRYPSLSCWLARRKERREIFGDEMRLLYVAMTRACHKLILAGTASLKTARQWTISSEQPRHSRAVLAARTCLDWLGPCFAEAIAQPDWTEQTNGRTERVSWAIYKDEDTRLRSESARKENSTLPREKIDSTAVDKLVQRMEWKYPFLSTTQEPAKTTVSILRRRVTEDSDADSAVPFSRARFGSSRAHALTGKLTAAEIGIAHHLFLQFVSLDQLGDLARLQAEAQRIEREGILSRPQRRALDLSAIHAFWQGEVGLQLAGQRRSLHRELSFTARLSLHEMHRLSAHSPAKSNPLSGLPNLTNPEIPQMNGDFVVIQGIIDLVALLPNEIWLLDFKTDSVTERDWETKLKEYTPQVNLYALALSRIYRKPVTRAWLHFLQARRSFECGRNEPA